MNCEEVGEVPAAPAQNPDDRACSKPAFTYTLSLNTEDGGIKCDVPCAKDEKSTSCMGSTDFAPPAHAVIPLHVWEPQLQELIEQQRAHQQLMYPPARRVCTLCLFKTGT